MKQRKDGGLTAPQAVILILIVPVAALWALSTGRIGIPMRDVLAVLWGKLSGNMTVAALTEKTVWNLRVPRVLLSMLAGSGLSCAGCAFQSLFANPLATPDTLGVASGASFGAALGLLIGLPLIGVQGVSLVMGLAAVALTWLAGSGRGRGLSSVVLAGIMIGSLFSALVSFVKFAADTEQELPSITYWLMGGLDKAGFPGLRLGAAPVLGGIVVLWLLRWKLNLLPLSEDEARSSGVNIRRLRLVTVFCATMITASCVSMCGQVGWVGLLIPHMCRMKFGGSHLALIPACVSTGAVFMLIVDTAARSLTAAEIPVSILTAIVGAPFFIILMRRSGGWQY